MFARFKPSSTFRRNLLINLITAALVTILVLILFFQMIGRFREQERSQREDLMLNEISHVADELSVLGGLFLQSKYPDSLARIALIKGELYPSDYYALGNARSYLSSIASANGLLADIVLSFSNSGVVLTRDNVYISQEQFLKQYRTSGFDGEALLEAPANGLSGGNFRRGGAVASPPGVERRVAFIYSFPLGASNVVHPSCYVHLLISYDVLMDALLTENMREYGSLEVLNEAGEALCDYSAGDGFSREGVRVTVGDSAGTLRVNAYLPEVYFFIALQRCYALVFFGIAAVFALSVFMAWFSAWRQALPMRRLIADIAGKGLGSPEQQNEYAWLRDNLQRMSSERADIARQLEQHQRQLRANALERLFAGTPLSARQRERAERALAGLPRPFLVGLARFRFSPAPLAEAAKNARAVVMLQKLERALPEGSVAYPFDTDTVALLIPCPSGQEAAARGVAASVSGMDGAEGGHHVELTLGTPLSQLQEIAASFDVVLQESGAEEWPEESGVRCVKNRPQEGDFSFRNLHQIYNLLVSADVSGARAALSGFLLSTDRRCGSLPQRFYTLRMLMMLAASALQLDDRPIRGIHYETSNDGAALLEKFSEFLPLFSDRAGALRLRRRDARTQGILDYFEKRYADPEFCPAAAAEAFSISEKHLYTLLKENTGRTPAALLLELRLARAAALLRDSDKPIQTVCEACGFANLNTFYKAFKRAYAVSPSQYRDCGGRAGE